MLKISQGLLPLEGPSAFWAPTAPESAQALVAMTITRESQSLDCDWLHVSFMLVCDWTWVYLSIMYHTVCTIFLTVPLFCPTSHPYLLLSYWYKQAFPLLYNSPPGGSMSTTGYRVKWSKTVLQFRSRSIQLSDHVSQTGLCLRILQSLTQLNKMQQSIQLYRLAKQLLHVNSTNIIAL